MMQDGGGNRTLMTRIGRIIADLFVIVLILRSKKIRCYPPDPRHQCAIILINLSPQLFIFNY